MPPDPRQADAEIEVTEEMVKAGVRAYWDADLRFCEIEDRVEAVYRAMAEIRKEGRPPCRPQALTSNEGA
jgi:hypothetical protein